MKEMGWSWRDLLEAPSDLIEEIEWKRQATQHWTLKRQDRDEAKKRNTYGNA